MIARLRVATLIACCVSLGACTSTLPANRSYVDVQSISTKLVGNARVVMAPGDHDMEVVTHPHSYLGLLTSADVPLGDVFQVVGEEVCSRYFTGGARAATAPADYIVEVKPKQFYHTFNTLSSYGFAVSPEVQVTAAITIRRGDGTIVVPEHVYSLHHFNGTGPYAYNAHPYNLIKENLHQAVTQIYLEAFNEIPRPSTY